MFKTDFVIFYEHVSRELESCQSLAMELSRRGLSGFVLPIHFYRRIRVALLKPRIIVVPFLYNEKNAMHRSFEKVYGPIPCLDLHSEQIVDETTRHMYSPTDVYARSVHHIAWSRKFARILIESGVSKDHIFIAGSIRNDSIITKRAPLPEDNNLLICTSFSNTFVAPAYIDHVLADHDIEPETYRKKIEITREVRDFYFREIERFANANPDVKITIRPHPYVEISDFVAAYRKVNNTSGVPDNVKVERRGSVQEAINSARQVVCWQSSVLLDAQLMGRRTFLMQQMDVPKYMEVPFSNVAANIKSLDQIHESGDVKPIPDVDIVDIYGAIDGMSSARVATAIERLLEATEHDNQLILGQHLQNLVRGLLVDFPLVILNKLGLLDKIFPLYKGITEDSVYYRYRSNRVPVRNSPDWEMGLGDHGFEFQTAENRK